MKKRIRNKMFAVILSAAMAMSLAACGSGSTETTESAQQAAGSEAAAAESTAAQDTEAASEGTETAETTGEPVHLTVEVFDRGNMTEEYGTPTDNKWTRIMHDTILEELNIDVEYVAIPRSEEVTKIQAMMAADSEPDIFFTYDAEQVIKWVDGEALADLTPYMEEGAGKELKDALGEDVLSFGVIEGKQYAINAIRYDQGQYCCFIRKDLLDQVGVELSELNGHYAIKPSELKDAMIKIKEAGLCDYPIGMYNLHDARMAIEGAFLTKTAPEDLARGIGGQYYAIDEEGIKEGYRFLNECYNAGLINPDFALFNGDNMAEMIASGQSAFWSQCYWLWDENRNALYEAEPDAEIVAVELTHEDGTPASFEMYAPIGAYGMVSSSCENVEAAVSLINWFMTSEDAHLITHHGIEGENFENKDGVLEPIDPEYNATDRVSVGDLNILLNYDPCTGDPAIFEKNTRTANETAGYADQVTDAHLEAQQIAVSEGKFVFPAINVSIQASVDYAAELSENSDNLWIGGVTAPEGQFDETWDSLYQTYMDEGGSQRAEERVAAYQSSQN